MPHIAILGGGCTGVLAALNLLPHLAETDSRLTIIEPRETLGAGLAFSSPDPAHRVNVPAEGMMVLDDEPGAFLSWLQAQGHVAADPAMRGGAGRHYPRRKLFGLYLNLLLRQKTAALPGKYFHHVQARATKIALQHGAYLISDDQGGTTRADILVLAVSHPPPAIPDGFRAIATEAGFIADPWRRRLIGPSLTPDARVLLIGTGLTAMDVVTTLSAQGHRGEIVAMSRRGLISRGPREESVEPFGDFTTPPHTSAVSLLRQVKGELRNAQKLGLGPQPVLESLRRASSEIWTNLDLSGRQRVLRHLRVIWDVHRFRMAPQIQAALRALQEKQQFTLLAARAISAGRQDGSFRVMLKYRNTTHLSEERFDAVINCTGPDHRHVTAHNPALTSLAAAGLVMPDSLGLGLQTDAQARAIGFAGRKSETLFIAGPLARAEFGEVTGLSQIRQHAAFVAKQILHALSAARITA